MRKIQFLIMLCVFGIAVNAQDIPVHVSYTRIYDFLDELATDGLIQIRSVTKPYSRMFVAAKLVEAAGQQSALNNRQKAELKFFMNEFAPELNKLPDSRLTLVRNDRAVLAGWEPAFHYKDSLAKIRIAPIIGMTVMRNDKGTITKRWYGADLQTTIGSHLTVYGSLRDISIQGQLLAKPGYLNDYPGYEYKESTSGGDYSDSRGGIKWANNWLSVGLVKDHVIWGDNYHGSNILSGRTPSFPMLTLSLTPVKWFSLQYFHGWLVSDIVDSTRYYLDNTNAKQYRMANKFIAANMLTFTPCQKLNISIGNSIIYGEYNVQPAYFIPVAFYKSIDHTLTKGAGIENQNSQVFLNISSRNIRHVHLYTSIFSDEIKMSRFTASDPEKNPISYKGGIHVTNFPIDNLSATCEVTSTSMIVYKHSMPALSWTNNRYNMGSYLGDNSQELYLALQYKPIRGLDLNLSYMDAKHGNEYRYIRREANGTDATHVFLSQPSPGETSWSNRTFAFNAQYELVQNAYAIVRVERSDIKGYDLTGTPIPNDQSEVLKTAQGYLDMFTPKYLQGSHTTITVGFSFGF